MENLPPQVIRRVTKEVMGLAEDPPEGIKVYLNEEDITDIQATIEGPGASLHGPELTGLVCNSPPSSPSFSIYGVGSLAPRPSLALVFDHLQFEYRKLEVGKAWEEASSGTEARSVSSLLPTSREEESDNQTLVVL